MPQAHWRTSNGLRPAQAMTPIQQLAAAGGALPASEWNTGHPDYHKRPVPSHCMECVAKDLSAIPARSRRACENILAKRPRVRTFVVVKNWDAVEQLTTSKA